MYVCAKEEGKKMMKQITRKRKEKEKMIERMTFLLFLLPLVRRRGRREGEERDRAMFKSSACITTLTHKQGERRIQDSHGEEEIVRERGEKERQSIAKSKRKKIDKKREASLSSFFGSDRWKTVNFDTVRFTRRSFLQTGKREEDAASPQIAACQSWTKVSVPRRRAGAHKEEGDTQRDKNTQPQKRNK